MQITVVVVQIEGAVLVCFQRLEQHPITVRQILVAIGVCLRETEILQVGYG